MLEGLREFGLDDADPSMAYRALRDMEVEGWVTSSWEPHETQGPPRRVYSLTDEGEAALVEWAHDLKQWRARIDRFLKAYQARTPSEGQYSPEKGE
jgi:DNA-binding PadR family transcriptional regulator